MVTASDEFHPFEMSDPEIVAEVATYLRALADGIEEHGYTLEFKVSAGPPRVLTFVHAGADINGWRADIRLARP